MSALTNYLENALINHILRNTAYLSPANVYVGLFTAVADGEAASVTELTGNNYARQAAAFGAPSDGSVTNSGDITFPQALANWGTITHFGIYDAVSGGNLLFYGALTASKTVNSGDQFVIKAGNLTASLA